MCLMLNKAYGYLHRFTFFVNALQYNIIRAIPFKKIRGGEVGKKINSRGRGAPEIKFQGEGRSGN